MMAKYQALYQCNRKLGLWYAFLGYCVCMHTYEETKEMQTCSKFTSEYCTLEYCIKVVCWIRTYLRMTFKLFKSNTTITYLQKHL